MVSVSHREMAEVYGERRQGGEIGMLLEGGE